MSRTAFAVRLLLFGGNEFQKVLDAAIQNPADSGQNINVQPGDFVVAVVIDLGALHLCPVAEFVLANASFLNQFSKLNSNGTVVLHAFHRFRR